MQQATLELHQNRWISRFGKIAAMDAGRYTMPYTFICAYCIQYACALLYALHDHAC